jgi:hypothetical protein
MDESRFQEFFSKVEVKVKVEEEKRSKVEEKKNYLKSTVLTEKY